MILHNQSDLWIFFHVKKINVDAKNTSIILNILWTTEYLCTAIPCEKCFTPVNNRNIYCYFASETNYVLLSLNIRRVVIIPSCDFQFKYAIDLSICQCQKYTTALRHATAVLMFVLFPMFPLCWHPFCHWRELSLTQSIVISCSMVAEPAQKPLNLAQPESIKLISTHYL